MIRGALPSSRWVLAATLPVLFLFLSCGDDKRTSPGDLTPPVTVSDVTPPATVSDLAVLSVSDSSVVLTWTAPGDDGREGVARRYELRGDPSPLVAGPWSESVPVGSPSPPKPGGEREVLTVAVPPERSWVFLALRAVDEADNWSETSNAVPVWSESWLMRVTDSPSGKAFPVWSPDGSFLMYQGAQPGPIDGTIWVVPSRGGSAIEISDSLFAARPQWSPDGRWVYFSAGGCLWRVLSTGGPPQRIVPRVVEFDLSPDGSFVVHTRQEDDGRSLWKRPTAGGDSVRLAVGPISQPRWSPDGTEISFVSDAHGASQVLLLSRDGGVPVSLNGDGTQAELRGSQWAPDGSGVGLVCKFGQQGGIWLFPRAGGPRRIVPEGFFPDDSRWCWAPSADYIIFESGRWFNEPVMVAREEGSPLRMGFLQGATDVQWSPDGTRLAYVLGDSLRKDIWVFDLRCIRLSSY